MGGEGGDGTWSLGFIHGGSKSRGVLGDKARR